MDIRGLFYFQPFLGTKFTFTCNFLSVLAEEQTALFCAYVASSSNENEALDRSDYFSNLYDQELFSVLKNRYAKAMSCALYPKLISRFGLHFNSNPQILISSKMIPLLFFE